MPTAYVKIIKSEPDACFLFDKLKELEDICEEKVPLINIKVSLIENVDGRTKPIPDEFYTDKNNENFVIFDASTSYEKDCILKFLSKEDSSKKDVTKTVLPSVTVTQILPPIRETIYAAVVCLKYPGCNICIELEGSIKPPHINGIFSDERIKNEMISDSLKGLNKFKKHLRIKGVNKEIGYSTFLLMAAFKNLLFPLGWIKEKLLEYERKLEKDGKKITEGDKLKVIYSEFFYRLKNKYSSDNKKEKGVGRFINNLYAYFNATTADHGYPPHNN